MEVFSRRGCDRTNRILHLTNRNGVMGFGTIGYVDDLTIFTVITDRQCTEQFAIRGVVTNNNAIFRYAGVTGAFCNHSAGNRAATQGDTRINVAVAALTNSYAAIAFGDRVITYSCSANTLCAGVVER